MSDKLLQTMIRLHFADIEIAVRIHPNAVWTGEELAGNGAAALATPLGNDVTVKRKNCDTLRQLRNINNIVVINKDGVWL